MKYIRLDNNAIVQEILPEYDTAFPGIPINERFSEEFLNECLEAADETEVETGMEYIPLENVFAAPITYTGDEGATVKAGESASVYVSWSTEGTWTVTNSGGMEVTAEETENRLEVAEVPEGGGVIIIAFTDTAHGRTKAQKITIYAGEG